MNERGSAIVDFVMVGALVLAVFMAVVQLGLALYVRNVITDSAADGARFGGMLGATPADAVVRTRYLMSLALPSSFQADVTAQDTRLGGVPTVQVRVQANLPVFAFTGIGPRIEVVMHALDEAGL